MLKPGDFAKTVVAVPPIALTADLKVDPEPNLALARHIREGGVTVLLYGGNANLYHYGLSDYAEALEMMQAVSASGIDVITSIGPDFGKAMDQASLVARAGLRNVMLLPVAFPADSHGVGDGARKVAARLGHGVILYIKRDNYVKPVTLRRLIDEGAVTFVKYAVERQDPSHDAYLDGLISEVGVDLIASGMGETPIINHIAGRHLTTFTSGAVCIAPRVTMRILGLLKAGRTDEVLPLLEPFLAFEQVRSKFGGIQVLHHAVTTVVAPMGPIMPFVSNLKDEFTDEVAASLEKIVAVEQAQVAAPGKHI